MARSRLFWLPAALCAALLSGCGADVQSGGGMQSYKETKSMVLDILKTEEGQKALQEASMQGGGSGGVGIQMLGADGGRQLQTAVKDILTDPNYNKQLKQMMMEPKFAGDFAKAISKEDKELHKDLMKDPEYQTMLLQIMKNPEFEALLLDVLKGTTYRKQAMMIFQETLQNPLFKAQLMDMMKKVIEEETKPKSEKAKDSEDSES